MEGAPCRRVHAGRYTHSGGVSIGREAALLRPIHLI
jgi:hypothetical protein